MSFSALKSQIPLLFTTLCPTAAASSALLLVALCYSALAPFVTLSCLTFPCRCAPPSELAKYSLLFFAPLVFLRVPRSPCSLFAVAFPPLSFYPASIAARLVLLLSCFAFLLFLAPGFASSSSGVALVLCPWSVFYFCASSGVFVVLGSFRLVASVGCLRSPLYFIIIFLALRIFSPLLGAARFPPAFPVTLLLA